MPWSVKKKSYGKHSKKRSAYKKKDSKKSYKKKERGVKRKKSFKKPSAKRFKSSKKRSMVGVPAPAALADIPDDAPDSVKAAMSMAYANSTRQTTTVCRNPRGPVSDRYWCKFRWSATAVNFPSVTTGSGYQQYVGNGLFSPFSGGQKPQFFTALGRVYAYYRVFAARMKCTFQNQTATPAGENQLVIIPTILPSTAWSTYLPGNQETLDTYQGPYGKGKCSTLGSSWDLGHASCYAKTKDLFGVSDLSDVQFGGNMTTPLAPGSNPINGYIWFFAVGSIDPVGAAAPLTVGQAEMEFWVLLDGPIQGTDINTPGDVMEAGLSGLSMEDEFEHLVQPAEPPKAPPPVYTPTLKRANATVWSPKV